MRFRVASLVALTVLTVAGCGGGNSGTTTPPPPTAPTVTSTTPASGATGVAINSAVTATFSQAMNAATISATTFTLTGSGGAAVTGTVTYTATGSVATFTPSANLAYNTLYTATITTGAADSTGTALAANYTWTFTTAAVPVAPTVTATTPASGATGVAINSVVTASFSQAMNATTLSISTFTLTGPGAAVVTGAVTYSATGSVATFTPSANLAYNTLYTATITTGAADSAGTALATNYVWTFTTAIPPTVTSITPANAATGVAITADLTAAFSQAMTASTINVLTFTVTAQGGATVAGTVTYATSGSVATFAPTANLAYNTQYTATITTGATSSTGTPLATNYSWTFTTAAAPVPTVTAVTPASLVTGVPINATVTATFSQPMYAPTVDTATFLLTAAGGAPVAGTVIYATSGSIATFTPSANLAYDTQYTATITTGAEDSALAPLAANYVWSFTTALAPAPTIAVTAPANGATNVTLNQALTATFSQAMNASTMTSSTFTLAVTGGAAVAGTVTYSAANAMATFTPTAALSYGTEYTATITTGATSSAGAALAANYTWSFTTAANPNLVTVDFGTADQIIRGFGGSTAWLGQLTTAQANALFSPSSGLGLSILRVRIDPTGSASANWVPTDGNWGQEVANAQAAVSANPNAIVFASPWTPPTSMKNSSVSQPYFSGTCSPSAGYCGGYLDPSNYAAYATYLEDFVTYFNAHSAFDLYAISMQNEPDYANVNYESCNWTAAQMDTWVAGNASVLTTKLIMPESFQFIQTQSNTALNDSNAESLISIIGGHIYGVSPAPYPLAVQDGKDLWMTEHALTPSGSQPTITDALAAAEEVHNSMVTGSYNAYVWWWIWDDPSDGVNYGLINSSTTSPAPTYYGYALGQFARFIQPGYYRYNATANPSAGVYVSAYAGTESSTQHYVIVAINASASQVSESFTTQNGTVTTLTPYQTTASGGLAQQSAVSVSSGAFTYLLPAQSITTFVQ
jgi:O-glycosyl hydrolase